MVILLVLEKKARNIVNESELELKGLIVHLRARLLCVEVGTLR